MPLRRELDEVQACAERNGDGGKNEEAGEDEEAPAAAPADVVADAGNFAHEDEGGEHDVDAEEHGEDVGEAFVRVGPEPVRGRSATDPVRRGKFYGDPDSREGEVILPSTAGAAFRGYGQSERNEDDRGDGSGA